MGHVQLTGGVDRTGKFFLADTLVFFVEVIIRFLLGKGRECTKEQGREEVDFHVFYLEG
jgi:hypothetical protein